MRQVVFTQNKQATVAKKAMAAFVLSVGVLTSACSESEHLEPLDAIYLSSKPETAVNVNFCTDPAYEQKQYLKTVIILDHSGSNKENFKLAPNGGPATPLEISANYATDPTGITRYGSVTAPGSLLNYLSTVPANDPLDPTKFFALVNFNSSTETYPGNSSGFTSDTVDFYDHVLADSTKDAGVPADGNSTSYLSALKAASDIITRDIAAAKACAAQAVTATPSATCPHPGTQTASSYVVVFMSDGSPIINISGIGRDPNGNVVQTGAITIEKEAEDQILGKTSAIYALTSDTRYVTSVNLFTIYYYKPGNVDAASQAILEKMAKLGNGVAYNALAGSQIDYTRFQPPKKRIKFTLKDVFVTNESAVWENDGEVHLDSDMDGLSDETEVKIGTNPNNAYSDRNGVNDFVKDQVCQSKNANGRCLDAVKNYRNSLCSGVSSQTVGGSVVFRSSDPNGLNDCEKLVLNNQGGINNPDSNGDLIPDWLEYKNGVPFQLGTTPAVNTPDLDGYSIYDKIKLSLPTKLPIHQLFNYKAASYHMRLVSSNNDQDCYALTVNDLPISGDQNMVRVEIVLKSELLRDNYLYRVGRKAFAPGSLNLNFNGWMDANEITLNTWRKWQ